MSGLWSVWSHWTVFLFAWVVDHSAHNICPSSHRSNCWWGWNETGKAPEALSGNLRITSWLTSSHFTDKWQSESLTSLQAPRCPKSLLFCHLLVFSSKLAKLSERPCRLSVFRGNASPYLPPRSPQSRCAPFFGRGATRAPGQSSPGLRPAGGPLTSRYSDSKMRGQPEPRGEKRIQTSYRRQMDWKSWLFGGLKKKN